MKEGIRVLGIDDAPREVESLTGVVYRGTEFMEAVNVIDQEPDTGDSTEDIIDLYRSFDQDLRALILDGVSFTGFNIADHQRISSVTGKTVISITSNKPNKAELKDGLRASGLDPGIVDRLPAVHEEGGIFFQFSGTSKQEAYELLKASTLQGKKPEAVRAAHLIGRGLRSR